MSSKTICLIWEEGKNNYALAKNAEKNNNQRMEM